MGKYIIVTHAAEIEAIYVSYDRGFGFIDLVVALRSYAVTYRRRSAKVFAVLSAFEQCSPCIS